MMAQKSDEVRKKTEAAAEKAKSTLLIDLLDDDDINCANCFI